MVLSPPDTLKQIMSKASRIEGLTLPGMMEDPGCTGGSSISMRPALGPMFISLRSELRFRRVTAMDRIAADKSRKAFMLLAPSVRFFADLSLCPLSLLRWAVTSCLYLGSVLIPVPTAVPPRLMVYSSFLFS